MKGEEAGRICVAACDGALDYIAFDRMNAGNNRKHVGISKKGVMDMTVGLGTATVFTFDRIVDTDSLGLMIGDWIYFEEIEFTFVDQASHMLVFRAPKEVLDELKNTELNRVKLVSDMTFLIHRCKAFYEMNGHLISHPPMPNVPADRIVFPTSNVASDDQRNAVMTMLDSPLSYVWGAPGTGKTQMVLSTAILAYMRNGGRVAVIAPTNNSVEQVLRGIFKMLRMEDPEGKLVDIDRDVIRLGLATKGFVDEFPKVCEKKAIEDNIRDCRNELDARRSAIMERGLEDSKDDFRKIEGLCSQLCSSDDSIKYRIRERIEGILDKIREVVAFDDHLSNIMSEVDGYSVGGNLNDIYDEFFSRDRPALDFYRDTPTSDMEKRVDYLQERIEELEPLTSLSRVENAKIVAMTPQVFMGRFHPRGSDDTITLEFDFDHIFVDEVGYCGLMNMLCFFSCGIPISLLGDHKQLPPVCEIDDEHIEESLDLPSDNPQKYLFMWNESSLFCEDFLEGTVEDAIEGYRSGDFLIDDEADLLKSHRFGSNLGTILDRLIYRNGINGVAKNPLVVKSIDAVCPPRTGTRANPEEVDRICDYLAVFSPDPDETAILTPYKDQIWEIKSCIPEEYEDCVMTIHKSQGREWDTVILSPADNLETDKEFPLRLTSTADPSGQGEKVINTAVSRAKGKLVIVCDERLWTSRPGELIGELVREAGNQRASRW